jgi:hypothetical protein
MEPIIMVRSNGKLMYTGYADRIRYRYRPSSEWLDCVLALGEYSFKQVNGEMIGGEILRVERTYTFTFRSTRIDKQLSE